MADIFIATSSFNPMQSKPWNQLEAVSCVVAAGANGIEIREELFPQRIDKTLLESCHKLCDDHGLMVHYSSPVTIWAQGGTVNPELEAVIARAKALNARLLKVNVGAFARDAKPEAFDVLRDLVRWAGMHMTVENDQTAESGSIVALQDALTAFKREDIPIHMTFDVGNWIWTGEEPFKAAQVLSEFVRYVHVKAADINVIPYEVKPVNFHLNDKHRLVDALLQLPREIPRCIEYSLITLSQIEIEKQVAQLRDFAEEMSV